MTLRTLTYRGGLALAALLVCVGVVTGLRHRDAVANLPARLTTRFAPPAAGSQENVPPRDRRALRRAATAMGPARLVWSTNRSGNHELVILDLQTQELRQITEHPNVDFAARFSPDGQQVVFLRSRREWVSFREADAWDVYVLAVEGTESTGEPRRVAEQGYHPSWSADGRSVIFQRTHGIHQVDLASGEETLLWDVSAVFGRATFGDVTLHPDGVRLAFAVSSFGAVSTRVDTAEYTRLTDSQVCQTLWTPDAAGLLWVEPEGNGGTRIVRAPADGGDPTVLMDLPGERSHEYFPSLSDDGRWMVWGAAAQGHEHDRADYDIFLWQLDTPWESAVRVTRHSGNDQWPDLHIDGAAR